MPDDLTLKLLAFLEEFDGEDVRWGFDDCSARCAAWVRECGYDIGLPAYSSEEEAEKLIQEAGGLVALWDRISASAGIYERIGEPKAGDVGIIPTNRFGPTGVIFAGPNLCNWKIGRRPSWMTPRSWLKVWAIT